MDNPSSPNFLLKVDGVAGVCPAGEAEFSRGENTRIFLRRTMYPRRNRTACSKYGRRGGTLCALLLRGNILCAAFGDGTVGGP